MTELAAVATELYALLPTEFTAARNARAKSEGGTLGTEVKSLPRPSAAAWAVNLLARERPDDVAQLFALGDSLRNAQDGFDRATLTKLGSQRRALVAALAKQAGSLAADAGHPVNAAAIIDVERTLQAGMSDAAAAAAVTSGRLVRALSGDGLEAVDLDDAVAGPLPHARARGKAKTPVKKAPSKKKVEAADAAVATARAAAADAERTARQAGSAKESLTLEREELREHLADVEGELADAARAFEAAERKRTTAARALEKAERERATLLVE
ncbi:transposase [Conyzicola sp.]|uniref:transposase n=1 Tax=Conyzicola sp. TaxID=1969404 RepID=UPI00398A1CF9